MINPTFDKKENSKWEYRIYTQYLDDEELKSENDWLNKGGKEGWESVSYTHLTLPTIRLV